MAEISIIGPCGCCEFNSNNQCGPCCAGGLSPSWVTVRLSGVQDYDGNQWSLLNGEWNLPQWKGGFSVPGFPELAVPDGCFWTRPVLTDAQLRGVSFEEWQQTNEVYAWHLNLYLHDPNNDDHWSWGVSLGKHRYGSARVIQGILRYDISNPIYVMNAAQTDEHQRDCHALHEWLGTGEDYPAFTGATIQKLAATPNADDLIRCVRQCGKFTCATPPSIDVLISDVQDNEYYRFSELNGYYRLFPRDEDPCCYQAPLNVSFASLKKDTWEGTVSNTPWTFVYYQGLTTQAASIDNELVNLNTAMGNMSVPVTGIVVGSGCEVTFPIYPGLTNLDPLYHNLFVVPLKAVGYRGGYGSVAGRVVTAEENDSRWQFLAQWPETGAEPEPSAYSNDELGGRIAYGFGGDPKYLCCCNPVAYQPPTVLHVTVDFELLAFSPGAIGLTENGLCYGPLPLDLLSIPYRVTLGTIPIEFVDRGFQTPFYGTAYGEFRRGPVGWYSRNENTRQLIRDGLYPRPGGFWGGVTYGPETYRDVCSAMAIFLRNGIASQSSMTESWKQYRQEVFDESEEDWPPHTRAEFNGLCYMAFSTNTLGDTFPPFIPDAVGWTTGLQQDVFLEVESCDPLVLKGSWTYVYFPAPSALTYKFHFMITE